ncbi:uncharacterized protein [Mytilus edulis]|uniref:uncharacterized protein n=1 Tax=Mytilus edulis TaxID=6550 RepID=UPI0039EE123D
MFIVKTIFIIGVVTKIHEGVPLFSPCKKELSTGKVHFFCCDNHEEKDRRCIECQIGYKSFDGKPCVECPQDFYGRKCSVKCKCRANQRCDHIKGCTDQLAWAGNISTDHLPNFKGEIDQTTKQVLTDNPNKGPTFITWYIVVASALIVCIGVVYFCFKKKIEKCRMPPAGQSSQSCEQNRPIEDIEVLHDNGYDCIVEV